MKKKPSKGIIIYCIFSLFCLVIAIVPGWYYIYEKILKIGVYNQEAFNIISDMFNRLSPPETHGARIIGSLVGGVIRLIIIAGLFTLKEWARKTEIILSIITFIYLLFGLTPPFLKSFTSSHLWIGYYLFNSLLLLMVLSQLVFIFFLTRPKVKEQFNGN